MLARLSGDEFAIIAARTFQPRWPPVASLTISWKFCEPRAKNPTRVHRSPPASELPYVRTTRPIGKLCSRTRILRSTARRMRDEEIYRFFEASMGAAVRDRRLLEHDLRNAIPRGELRLVYQPQKDIRGDRVVGFEALLRWKHPTRGEVPPVEFIPDCGRYRHHSSDRRVGAPGSVPRSGDLDRAVDRRGQHLGCTNPQRQISLTWCTKSCSRPGSPPDAWNLK